MIQSPLISVILSVFNAEKYLRAAIDSILVQTFSDFELIIIDDASGDASLQIIKSYSDPRIRLIENERNLGLAASLNKGIRMAKGRWIARMDADDISLPQRFEQQLAYLQAHPECDLLATQVIFIDRNGKKDTEPAAVNSYVSAEEIRRIMPHLNCLPHSSIMARSDLMRQYLYDETFNHSQDYDLWLRLLAEGRQIHKLEVPLMLYRVHAEAVGATRDANDSLRSEKVRLKYLAKRLKSHCFNRTDALVLKSVCADTAGSIFRRLKRQLFYYVSQLVYKPPALLLSRVFKEYGLFFFFPDYLLAGSELVHAQIVRCAAGTGVKSMVFFTNSYQGYMTQDARQKGARSPLLAEYQKYARVFDLSKPLEKWYTAIGVKIALYTLINARQDALVFCGNSTYLYNLIPELKPHVRIIDIIHSVGGAYFKGIEIPSLPHVPRIERRVAINHRTRDDLLAFYNEREIDPAFAHRLELIENSVMVPPQYPQKENAATPKENVAALKVLYVGRHYPEKRVHLVGKTAHACANVGLKTEFLVAGNVIDGISEEDRPFCTFLGEIGNREAINELYRTAHIILISSTHEGFPMVLMEGMAFGAVPLCTRVGGIPIHVRDGENGCFVPSGEEAQIVQDFTAAIARLQGDPQELARLSHNAYEYARAHFSSEQFCNAYRRLFALS